MATLADFNDLESIRIDQGALKDARGHAFKSQFFINLFPKSIKSITLNIYNTHSLWNLRALAAVTLTHFPRLETLNVKFLYLMLSVMIIMPWKISKS